MLSLRSSLVVLCLAAATIPAAAFLAPGGSLSLRSPALPSVCSARPQVKHTKIMAQSPVVGDRTRTAWGRGVGFSLWLRLLFPRNRGCCAVSARSNPILLVIIRV